MKKFLQIIKKCFLSVVVMTTLFSLAACGDVKDPIEPVKNKTRVIVMAGQSNMEGWSNVSYAKSNLSEEEFGIYNAGSPSVRMAFYKSSASQNGNPFQSIRFGLGMSEEKFGPEIGMSRYLKENASGSKFYLIKYAVGGTNMYNDWISPSSGRTGEKYRAMMDYVKSVLSWLTQQKVDFSVTDFCFMQGEADADTSLHALDYEDRLRAFVSDVRNDLKTYAPEDGIRFIDGGISDSSYWGNYYAVNESKKAVAKDDAKNVYIDTIAAGLQYQKEPVGDPDLAHYDALSMIELGKLFARAILA